MAGMAKVDLFDANAGTLLGILQQDQSAQKSQLAQYAILRAAELMKEKRHDDAIAAFKQALAFDPQNTTALDYIGRIQLARNNTAEAIRAYKELVRVQPDNLDGWMSLGNAYFLDGQYDESEKAYLHAAKLDRLSPLPVYTLGLQYLNTGRLQQAEEKLLEAQRLAPSDGNVYYALGQLYNKRGDFTQAVEVLKRALELKPNFPMARYELGLAYSNLEQMDAANEQLKALKREAPNSTAYSELAFALDRPRMLAIESAPQSPFPLALGAKTQLWFFDPAFLTPGASKVISVKIQFSQKMDMASVTNPANWTISRAKGGVAGYYNNTLPVTAREANVARNPLSVTYDAKTGVATVNFMLSQNDTVDATIDPRHLVFQFNGVDAYGRRMDKSGDEIDGAAGRGF
ncbi:MAG: tetratricopeptide repeat protein [Methylophilaceae bacterium]|nr:tetratricopeptide repeat protein [Methylophilaceae bacterium]